MFINERRLQVVKIQESADFDLIVDKYSDMIFRLAYQNLYNIPDAEDVVQDVFLKLLKSNKAFESMEHVKAWLIRVTVNQCLDYKKSFYRKNVVSLENQVIPLKENEQCIIEEIFQLPTEESSIIYMYYYEGYTIREIAEILGKKQNTVNSKLTRARKKLKKLLLEGGYGEEYL